MTDFLFGQIIVSATASLILSGLLLRRRKALPKMACAILLTILGLITLYTISLAMLGYGLLGKLSITSFALAAAFCFCREKVRPAAWQIWLMATLCTIFYLGFLSGKGVWIYFWGYSFWMWVLIFGIGVIQIWRRNHLAFGILCAGLFLATIGIYQNIFNVFIDGALWLWLVIYSIILIVRKIISRIKRKAKDSGEA